MAGCNCIQHSMGSPGTSINVPNDQHLLARVKVAQQQDKDIRMIIEWVKHQQTTDDLEPELTMLKVRQRSIVPYLIEYASDIVVDGILCKAVNHRDTVHTWLEPHLVVLPPKLREEVVWI